MSDAAKPDPSDAKLVLEYEFDAPPAKVWRAVTIPASLVVKPNNKGMQKLKVLHADGKLETRDVRIGLRNADKAQVLTGLAEGEQVLLPASSATAVEPPQPAQQQRGNAG